MTISTLIRTHECPELVIGAVQGIFPEWFPNSVPDSATFPCGRDEIRITGSDLLRSERCHSHWMKCRLEGQ